jgi:hypothetical protein
MAILTKNKIVAVKIYQKTALSSYVIFSNMWAQINPKKRRRSATFFFISKALPPYQTKIIVTEKMIEIKETKCYREKLHSE